MDLKRFGLFLILSWLIFTFAVTTSDAPKKKAAGAEGAAGIIEPLDGAGALPGATGTPGEAQAAGQASLSPQVQGAEPWSEDLIIGSGDVGRFQVRFDSLGGVLAEVRTADYFVSGNPELDREDPKNWMPLARAFTSDTGYQGSLALRAGPSAQDLVPYDLTAVHWDHELLKEGEVLRGVRFFHKVEANGLLIEKTVRAMPGEHEWQVELALSGGEGMTSRQAGFVFSPAVGMVKSSSDPYYEEPKARACAGDDGDWDLDSETVDANPSKIADTFNVSGQLLYGGMDNKYFAMLLRPTEGTAGEMARFSLQEANWRMHKDVEWGSKHPKEKDAGPYHHVSTDLGLTLTIPDGGTRLTWDYRLYVGPKKRKEFAAILPAHEQLLRKDLGFFDGIATFLLSVLNMFHSIVGNWGVAIILLTLTVRFALFPFNRRSQTAMAKHATKMKRVQPKINEIKEKYKNDPRKLREAQAKVMQEEGAFPPLGGCLPPLVQIPIFFGLFSALRVAFDLRHERFLWIDDLAMPDHLAHLGINTHLPFIGVLDWLNILPIQMVVLWITQQKVMPKPSDPQAQQMHKMMMWMPIVFGVFLYNYAAGLSLYMVTSSLFGIFEYTVVRKIWPLDESEAVKKGKGKLAKRMETMMKEAQRMQEQKQAGQRKNPGSGKKGSGGGGKKKK